MERDCESELSKLNIEQNACIYHFGASVIHGQRSNILRLLCSCLHYFYLTFWTDHLYKVFLKQIGRSFLNAQTQEGILFLSSTLLCKSYSVVFPHSISTTTETLIQFFISLFLILSPSLVKTICLKKCLKLRISTQFVFVATHKSPHVYQIKTYPHKTTDIQAILLQYKYRSSNPFHTSIACYGNLLSINFLRILSSFNICLCSQSFSIVFKLTNAIILSIFSFALNISDNCLISSLSIFR